MKKLLFALALLLAAGCGGGSATPIPVASTPANAPTLVSNAPLSSSPALTPTSIGRREAQDLPAPTTFVESSGTAAIWGGDFVTWVTNPQTGDVPEASAQIIASNSLQITDSMKPISCTTNVTSTAWCLAHPLAWTWGTSSSLTKPIGKQTLAIVFGDGSHITITDYVFNGWLMACGQSIAYQGGVMVTVPVASADVTYDCANHQVVFPHGVVIAAPAQADVYGRFETILPTITNAVAVPNGSPTALPFAGFPVNAVLVIGTTDGGFAKIYPNQPGGLNWTAASLHAQVGGTYAY